MELGGLGAGQAQPCALCLLRGWGRAELLKSLGIRTIPQLSLFSWPKDGEQLRICVAALFLPFQWCMTGAVNKAENAGIQDVMVLLSPNFQFPEGKPAQ